MTGKIKIIHLCLFAVVLSGCKEAETKEAMSVRSCFDSYNQSILDQDGDAAVALVDASTLKYYGKMRMLALKGSPRTVRKLSTGDKLMVLMLRHLIPFEDLSEMTAESLFVYAVDEGWIGRESVTNNELGEITVSVANATGVHIFEGNESPIKWNFRYENDKWKINLTSMMPIADQAFKQVIQKEGLSEIGFIFRVLQSISGRKVSDSIWEPLADSGN